ncbi:hypothetical protein PG989_010268 [Apiospora arundinis]
MKRGCVISLGRSTVRQLPQRRSRPQWGDLSPPDIQYTTKCYDPELETALSGRPGLSSSQSDLLHSQGDYSEEDLKPIVEVVTVVDTADFEKLNGNAKSPTGAPEKSTASIRDRHIIVHSETLSQTIRDVVRFYPGSKHLEVLLQFLRPLFERQYAAARNRLGSEQPTVRFDDLWVLMKPGSLAYIKWEGEWLGCIVGECIKHLPDDDFPRSWEIRCWVLQVYWPSNEIRLATCTFDVSQYDGEQLVTSLPVCVAEFHDAKDLGVRRRELSERGRKTCQLIWEGPQYTFYDGKCLSKTGRYRSGHIIVTAMGAEWLVKSDVHRWSFNWSSSDVNTKLAPDDPLALDEQKINRDRRPTMEQFAIMSPCLSVYELSTNVFGMVHVDRIKSLDFSSQFPEPILSNRKLATIIDLVDFQGHDNDHHPSDLSNRKGKGVNILLHGPPGAGKTYTIDYISKRTRRPVLHLAPIIIKPRPGTVHESFIQAFSQAEKWNAIVVIDNCDEVFHSTSRDQMQELNVAALKYAIATFRCLVFFTTNKIGALHERISSFVDLAVHIDKFDDERRKLVWERLEESFKCEDESIVLSRSAKELLRSPETRINWNGHEMRRCFKTAIALATAQGDHEIKDGVDKILVGDEHFKEAMNIAHEFRRYLKSVRGSEAASARRLNYRNDNFDPDGTTHQRRGRQPGVSYESDDSGIDFAGPPGPPKGPPPQRPMMPVARDTWLGDPDLCVPDLNFLEWAAFQESGNIRELFRKTKFHAVDVLVGEPLIKLKPDSKGRRRRDITSQGGAATRIIMPQAVSEQTLNQGSCEPGEDPLPERIRINSPALVRAFSDITEERLTSPFLLFRPFMSLIYYEQEFRKWASQQEDMLKSKVTSEAITDMAEVKTDDESAQPDIESKHISAGIQEMRCLLSFIDNHIKKKQAYLLSDRWDLVLARDSKQAYRITKVTSKRHRVKSRAGGDLDFWKDETEAEFADDPIFVHYIHVDFDGTMVGPVSHISAFVRFQGKMSLDSLSIHPLRHSKDDELRERLISRGRLFLEVAGIKQMHYTGLTLETRDEIDSQVVIDFDEAFDRFPKWKPVVTQAADEWLLKKAQDPRLQDTRSNKPEDEWMLPYQNSLRLKNNEGLLCGAYEIKALHSAICIHYPERLQGHQGGGTMLTDEDFMIMSYRVFGFVLRNRKWHELDMTNVSEVAILGEGEGFDQLVLPPGHGNMVKSMIRQHLRDRRLASETRDKIDVVRGKGRGLVMLLHGVPGVGKTSTAECVADAFRRPLFQITSGDLGTTAREVEDALEQNFNLASRWDCILLIDEADVFLGERNREDFVRNSLVAVFLRMMEYYAGILFLTTNRVGVFDEAFTSRIHISLYYPPLGEESTVQIFEKNWERIKSRYEKNNRKIEIKESEIKQFAIDYYQNNKEGQWNGRQIRNAFQSALALAELEALGTDDDLLDETDHGRTVILGKKYFETVANTYKEFLNYLKQVYGADFARRARENLWRSDTFGFQKIPNALTGRQLRVPDPMPPTPMGPPRAHPGPGLQPQAAYGHGYREVPPPLSSVPYYQSQQPQPQPQPQPQQHQYPPPQQQQYYQDQRYDPYSGQMPRYVHSQDPYVAPQDRFAAPTSEQYVHGPGGFATGSERAPQTAEQSFRPNAPREPGLSGREAGDQR